MSSDPSTSSETPAAAPSPPNNPASAPSPPESTASAGSSGLAWLYTHNPFYAVSVVLMLYGVRAGYGELEIGSINCWIMLGVLAGYTLLLAGIAVALVRWAAVWDDARSLFLLLLLLFLAVSVSADELFVRSDSPTAGVLLLLSGFLASAALSEAVLRGARIRLGWAFRGPYHLMLALFYAYPWWCSPSLHPRSADTLEWTIFLFPTAAAGLFLFLLPAARRGESYVADNGTPWPWPWFPWTMFGVIAAAVALRSFILSMTFGPIGPIWKGATRTLQDINFATIFGPYFLIPLGFVLAWLLLEGAIAAGNVAVQQRVVVFAPPLLLLMALPIGDNAVFRSFFDRFVDRIGSPIWLTAWLLVAFCGRAWLARVPLAPAACAVLLLLLTMMDSATVSLRTLTAPQPWPIFLIGLGALYLGARRRSSAYCLTAAALFSLGLWLATPQTMAAAFRMTLSYHVLWVAIIAVGLLLQDRLAAILRAVGAMQIPATALVVFGAEQAQIVPMSWRVLYVLLLTAAVLVIAALLRERWFLYAFFGMLALAMYGGTMLGYRQAASVVGRPAMMAITWSVGSLLLGVLISARKANWLPPGLTPSWFAATGTTLPPAAMEAPPSQPPSSADAAANESTAPPDENPDG